MKPVPVNMPKNYVVIEDLTEPEYVEHDGPLYCVALYAGETRFEPIEENNCFDNQEEAAALAGKWADALLLPIIQRVGDTE